MNPLSTIGAEKLGEPRYVTIARVLEQDITSWDCDRLRPRRLPSERSLGVRFDPQRPTVREALQLLAARGLMFRKDRLSWYVAPPRLNYDPTSSEPLSEIAKTQGRRLPEVLTIDPTGQPASNLARARFLVLRRRYLDDIPVLIKGIYIQEHDRARLLSLDLSLSIHCLLQHKPAAHTTYEVLPFSSSAITAVANLLNARTGSALLEVQRTRFHNDEVSSFDIEFWKPEAIHITFNTDWTR